MTPPPGGQDSWAWWTSVAVAVDHGLLEAERVNEEADQGPGVAGPQGGPHLRWRGVIAHDHHSPSWVSGPDWTFRNSSASQADGGQPGQLAELAGQVGLVVVAALGGQAGQGPARRPAGRPGAAACAGPGRTGSPGRRPWGSGRSRSAAGVAGSGGSSRPAGPVPRPGSVPPLRVSSRQASAMSGVTCWSRSAWSEQDLVEQREPGGPAVRLAEPLVQFPGHVPEHLGRRPRRSRPVHPRGGRAGPGRLAG